MANLDLLIGTILAIFDLQVAYKILPSLESICLSVKEKKLKIDVQDGGHGGHLEYFRLKRLKLLFIYKLPQYLLTSFELIGHLGFPIETSLFNLDLQVVPILPTNFRVNWPFVLGEKVQNIFSRWRS